MAGLYYSLPVRWLYEDMEEEITQGRKLYLAKIEESENKQDKKKKTSGVC